MEEVSSNSNLSIYYIMAIVLLLAAVFNIFFYTRRKKLKSRRLKSIMAKLKIESNYRSVSDSKGSIIKLTALGLFVLTVASVGLSFYIERLMVLDKNVMFFAGAVFVSTEVTIFIIRLKINKQTFSLTYLPPVMFTSEINLVFSVPMFLTSIYTVVFALAIPAVFVVSFNKIMYLTIIGLLYILWLIILTAPREVNIRSVEKHYRAVSASGIIKYYESFSQRSLKEDKTTKVLVSVNKVFAYLFYEEYEKADNELNKFDWDGQCESLRFNRKTLLAVKSYLNDRHLEGYKFAYEARDELKSAIDKYANRHFLTYGQHEKLSTELFRYQDIITDIGKILSGSLDRILINKLADRFEEMKGKNISASLLMAWCLSKAYANLGEKGEQAAMCRFIKDKAPYCKALN